MEVTNPETKPPKQSHSFESSYLLMFDFDGTMGQTFEASPSGIGVEENYVQTIEQIFGDEVLETYLVDQGGLQNRNPSEVIHDLYETHMELVELSKAHLEENYSDLSTVMPSTAHLLDYWEEDPLKATTEVYIRQDLINSLGHIGLRNTDGSVWPRPCKGFDSLWETIQELNASNRGFAINTAVISSGYTEYIEKTFDVWNLPYPDIFITDNETRSRKYPSDHLRRVKPAPFGVALAHQAWLKMYDKTGRHFDIKAAEDSKKRMFLFGDGLEKDGGMAERSKIGFGHFDPNTEEIQGGSHITFGNWSHIEQMIYNSASLMAGSVAAADIIRAEQ